MLNSGDVHPQLSHNGHPMDGVLVGVLVHSQNWELEHEKPIYLLQSTGFAPAMVWSCIKCLVWPLKFIS
jgi:hypothetical protein